MAAPIPLRALWRRLYTDSLYRNSAYFFLNTLAVSTLGFCYWWLSTRIYPVETVGHSVILISTGQLITTITQFGISFSLVRFLPEWSGHETRLINFALTFVTGVTAVVSLATILFGWRISPSLNSLPTNPALATLFALFVIGLAGYQLTYPILAALRAGRLLLATSVGTFAGRIILLLILSRSPSIYNLLLAFALPTAVGALLTFGFTLRYHLPGYSIRWYPYTKQWKKIIGYAAGNYGGNVLHDLPYQTLPQLIANGAGAAEAAYFFIVWKLFGLLTTLGNAISLSIFVEGSHNRKAVHAITTKGAVSTVVLTGALALITIVFARPLLFVFGQEYLENAIVPLRIVALAAVPAAVVYAKAAALRVRLKLRPVVVAFGTISVVTLGAILLLNVSNLAMIAWVWGASQVLAAAILLFSQHKEEDTQSAEVKKVIFVHPMDSFCASQGGGIRYLMNSLKVFAARGWDATVLGLQTSTRAGATSVPWQQIDLITVRTTKGAVWLSYLLNLYTKLPFLSFPTDAVIVTHRMDCMLAFVLFKRHNPKVLVSATPAHYLRLHHPTLFRLFGWLYYLAEKLCISGTDFVVPTDWRTKKYYEDRYPGAALTSCVPSAIDLEQFPPMTQEEARHRLGWPKSAPTVLFVGRLAAIKNLPLLFDAFAGLLEHIPQAILRIVGAGESDQMLRALAERRQLPVRFEGVVSPHKVAVYYAAADVLVLTSREEGSPTVIKEALAAGIPVVSTDVGDVAELLKSDIRLGLITKDSPTAVAGGLIHFLEKCAADLLVPRLQRTRREAVLRFGIEQFGEQLLAICTEARTRRRSERESPDLKVEVHAQP